MSRAPAKEPAAYDPAGKSANDGCQEPGRSLIKAMIFDFAQGAVKSRRNPLSGFTGCNLTAWIAILGLYLQIASSALGGIGAPVDKAFAGTDNLFPICHAAMGDEDTGQSNDGNAPVDQHTCPACSIHCHASMVIAPSTHELEPLRIVTASALAPSFIVPSSIRFEAAVLPRGPPSTG